MNAIRYFLHFPLVETLGWTLVHFLWEGAVIGVVGWLLLRATYKAAPNVRYLIACGLMLACVASPAITFLILQKSSQENITLQTAPALAIPQVNGSAEQNTPPQTSSPLQPSQVSVQSSVSIARPAISAQTSGEAAQAFLLAAANKVVPWAVPAWFLGILFLGTRLCFGWCRIQFWRMSAIPAADPAVLAMFSRLAHGFRRGKRVRLLLCKTIPSPLTLGWLKPVILLPAQILTGLSQAQIEAVLAHEIAHIRRHDYLANLLQSTVEIVLFYHPVVWWLSRRVREIREECCDEEAVRVCPGRLAYAEALAALAETRFAAGPAMAASGGSLLSRISRLLGRPKAEPVPGGRNAAWLLALTGILIISLTILDSARLMAGNGDQDEAAKEVAAFIQDAQLPIEVDSADIYTDGGTITMVLKDAARKKLELCIDGREESNGSDGVFIDAPYPGKPGAKQLAPGGTAETQILDLLKKWLLKNVTDDKVRKLLEPGTPDGFAQAEALLAARPGDKKTAYVLNAVVRVERRRAAATAGKLLPQKSSADESLSATKIETSKPTRGFTAPFNELMDAAEKIRKTAAQDGIHSGDPVPEKDWPQAVKALAPLLVYTDRGNVVFVQRRSLIQQYGLYIAPIAGSYSPKSGGGWTFRTLDGRVYDFVRTMVDAPLAFSPVTGREVPGAIDFDTGKLSDPPSPVMTNTTTGFADLEKLGMDAERANDALFPFGMKGKAVKSEDWDKMSPVELAQELAPLFNTSLPEMKLSQAPDAPTTFIFQTDPGAMGIAQILGLTDDKSALKIRYKLIQSKTDAANSPAPEASAANNDISTEQERKLAEQAAELLKKFFKQAQSPIEVDSAVGYHDGGSIGLFLKDAADSKLNLFFDNKLQSKNQGRISVSPQPVGQQGGMLPASGEAETQILQFLKTWFLKNETDPDMRKLLEPGHIEDAIPPDMFSLQKPGYEPTEAEKSALTRKIFVLNAILLVERHTAAAARSAPAVDPAIQDLNDELKAAREHLSVLFKAGLTEPDSSVLEAEQEITRVEQKIAQLNKSGDFVDGEAEARAHLPPLDGNSARDLVFKASPQKPAYTVGDKVFIDLEVSNPTDRIKLIAWNTSGGNHFVLMQGEKITMTGLLPQALPDMREPLTIGPGTPSTTGKILYLPPGHKINLLLDCGKADKPGVFHVRVGYDPLAPREAWISDPKSDNPPWLDQVTVSDMFDYKVEPAKDQPPASAPPAGKFPLTPELAKKIETFIKKAPVSEEPIAELYDYTPGAHPPFHMRANVVALPFEPVDKTYAHPLGSGEVLCLPGKKFYIEWDGPGADPGDLPGHCYGPFWGDPAEALGTKLIHGDAQESSSLGLLGDDIVERPAIMDLIVSEVKGVSDLELQIKGTDGNSAFIITSVKSKQAGKEINILAVQSMVGFHGAKPGQSGTFDYTVKIPAGVEEVTFGKKKAVIWKRGTLTTKTTASPAATPLIDDMNNSSF